MLTCLTGRGIRDCEALTLKIGTPVWIKKYKDEKRWNNSPRLTSLLAAEGMAAGLSVGPTFCNFVGGSAEAETGVFFVADVAGRLAGTMSTDFDCVVTEVEEVDAAGVAWTKFKGLDPGRFGECEYRQL